MDELVGSTALDLLALGLSTVETTQHTENGRCRHVKSLRVHCLEDYEQILPTPFKIRCRIQNAKGSGV